LAAGHSPQIADNLFRLGNRGGEAMHTFDYIAIGVLIVLVLLGARWLFAQRK
jgi:hypothetical protein